MRISSSDKNLMQVGKKRSGFTSKMPYSVIYDGEAQTALVLVGERERAVSVMNWTTVDQFWVDEASESEVTRYFFKRKLPATRD